ncbi:hypothetical protein BSL78_06259 [Apostichopus japonicus]|uniref:Uncharacterized protein n=1 Tax=Stichopus japonicus TaxID=307972 RepID=A0A2G8L9C5_STIJA|nr:hypothetical protein BSL78_06259 [Apostichopus japonicus]
MAVFNSLTTHGLLWITGQVSIISFLLVMLLVNQYTTTKINLQQRASSSVHRMLQGRDGHPHLTSYQDGIPLDCHVLHRSNSCNNLPNYFMYSSKRPQFKSTVINFMHVPKSGGTTMKECMNMVASNLVRDEPFLLHTEGRIQVTQDILNGDFRILNSTSLFMGDYSFGFCDLIHGIIGDKKCSTFVILREPYDRMVSNYYYCIELNQTIPGIPDCRTHTITEWALRTKSILWNEIFTDIDCTKNMNWECKMNYRTLEESYLLSQNTTYVEALVAGLDKHFSVVGLTEDMETSLKMLQQAYGLPFFDTCQTLDYNAGTYKKTMNKKLLKSIAKNQLMAHPAVRELLYPEILMYNRAKEIFEIQKKELESL